MKKANRISAPVAGFTKEQSLVTQAITDLAADLRAMADLAGVQVHAPRQRGIGSWSPPSRAQESRAAKERLVRLPPIGLSLRPVSVSGRQVRL